jgi:hypothetical protein
MTKIASGVETAQIAITNGYLDCLATSAVVLRIQPIVCVLSRTDSHSTWIPQRESIYTKLQMVYQ